MLSFREARTLRQMDAPHIVDEYSAYTRSQFSSSKDEALPVLIAARNEEDDLPATLLALANSDEPVRPIVIENGSNDETAYRAKKMGALVIELEQAYKLAALQVGIRLLIEDRILHKPVLFTDADTLPGKSWSGNMKNLIDGNPAGQPGVLGGRSVFMNGPSTGIDILRTLSNLLSVL